MDLRRLRIPDLVVGLAGVLLAVSLFLPWYGFEVAAPAAGVPPRPTPDSLSGWEALSAVDVFLMLVGLGGIALVVVTATQRTVAVPIALAALLTLVALGAAAVVGIELTSVPDPPESLESQIAPADSLGGQGEALETRGDRRAGIFIAALATLLGVLGGMFSMRDERLSRPGRPTDMTGRPIAAPARIEAVPAPPADPARRPEVR